MATEDHTTERWNPIEGYEGYYSVSDHGRVRSEARVIMRSNGAPQTWRERILSPVSLQSGHLLVTLCREGSMDRVLVHRLVLEAFVGPCPDGMECRHLNGVADDNRLENLAWGTHAENCADTIRHGRSPKGERQGGSKLREIDARAIAWMTRVAGAKGRTLAKWYGVSAANISCIKIGKSWAWATKDIRP